MKDAIAEAAESLRRRLIEIDEERERVRKALAAIQPVAWKTQGTGQKATVAAYTLTCKRCGKPFTGYRPWGKFCHNPCTSSMYQDDQAAQAPTDPGKGGNGDSKAEPAASKSAPPCPSCGTIPPGHKPTCRLTKKAKGVTLLPGDRLKAGH